MINSNNNTYIIPFYQYTNGAAEPYITQGDGSAVSQIISAPCCLILQKINFIKTNMQIQLPIIDIS